MKHVIMQSYVEIPVSNIFCVGRNYKEHARELNNPVPQSPLIFLKPTSSILNVDEGPILLPAFSSNVHFETELLVLMGDTAINISADEALHYVKGYGIGLDLTARDEQEKAKAAGLPWTKAKGFPTAACISHFIPVAALDNVHDCTFHMTQNDTLKQTGNTNDMLFSVQQLIAYLSQEYHLQAGDVIFTGTPAGVGPIQAGDLLELDLANKLHARFHVSA